MQEKQEETIWGVKKRPELNFGHFEFKVTSDIHAEVTHKHLKI